MQTKSVGILSLACLILTILWLIFFIVSAAGSGPLKTFDEVLAYVVESDVMFCLVYVNASLITVSVVLLFAALYAHFKPFSPKWVMIGVIFVPIYGAMNLFAYLSQITIVPRLLELYNIPQYQAFSEFLLRQAIQQWRDSAIFIVNNLAYAVLGIPSAIFGLLMLKSGGVLRRIGGVLLSLNGLACVAGFIGIAARSVWLSKGSVVGGILFMLALAPMSWSFLRAGSNTIE